MICNGDNYPPRYSVSEIPNMQGYALVRLVENVRPYTETRDDAITTGYEYDEYTLVLLNYDGLHDDVGINYATYLAHAIAQQRAHRPPSEMVAEVQTQVDEDRVVASIAFVAMAQSGQLDDTTIAEHTDLFPVWDANWRGKAQSIVRDDGGLYRSIHDVTDAGQNRKPSDTPNMWTPIGDPADEWPAWSQPLGQHDAYDLGAKVTHNGKHWISGYAANTWEPGVFGWTVQP